MTRIETLHTRAPLSEGFKGPRRSRGVDVSGGYHPDYVAWPPRRVAQLSTAVAKSCLPPRRSTILSSQGKLNLVCVCVCVAVKCLIYAQNESL